MLRGSALICFSLRFADDDVLTASSEHNLQRSLEKFAADKNQQLHDPEKRVERFLMVGDVVLPQVKEFRYSGSSSRMRENCSRSVMVKPNRKGLHLPVSSVVVMWAVIRKTRSRIHAAELSLLLRVSGLGVKLCHG